MMLYYQAGRMIDMAKSLSSHVTGLMQLLSDSVRTIKYFCGNIQQMKEEKKVSKAFEVNLGEIPSNHHLI